MRCDDCSPDVHGFTSMGQVAFARHRWTRFLGGVATILGRVNAIRIPLHG